MNLFQYTNTISERYMSGISGEHSYRADLENLIREIVPNISITNEPLKVTECGNPDYVITNKSIPIGFIEAKDIAKDLNSKQYYEQFDRYKKALDNLIITDYLWFQFYEHGNLIHEIRIGEIEQNTVKPIEKNFEKFQLLIQNFCTFIGQTIKSPKKLAGMMAAKAKLLETIIEHAISSDEKTEIDSSLKGQYKSFKEVLIHDLNPKRFADIYAQTLAYGMFAARLNDTTLNDFSRKEAAELIPKSNPFLRKLFQYIAGYDIDDRIKSTVDNLADVFRATDVKALIENLGRSTGKKDPIIHFYETFLTEYDPNLRKSRGVWYTPESVVKFIVQAVDDILKNDFSLKDGISDISTTKIKVKVQGASVEKGRNKGKDLYQNKTVHRVQILDPATGTGTFLSEVVKYIHNAKFHDIQGYWNSYVEEHLIPRLNGFELLMASYSIAHLKLDMLLRETGFTSKKNQRFNIFLTNSLEEYHPHLGTLFSTWLSDEASEADHIKRDTPVMVVMGNPPYSVSSSNNSDWIKELMAEYKKDLNERNIQPLSDDYIKFIRYGQYYVEKNGEGILAYISNNSFIDGLIHRRMRQSLLESFDKIYILDLHGSTKRKEKTPDGGKDANVFDIQSGVSINIFIKIKKKKSKKCNVFKYDLFGSRAEKYSYLSSNTLSSIKWDKIKQFDDQLSFKLFKESDLNNDNSFKLNELFLQSASGITTERDVVTIQFSEDKFKKIVSDFENLNEDEVRFKYRIGNDGRDWKIETAKKDLNVKDYKTIRILYRPFDKRYSLYTGRSKGFHSYPRAKVTGHLINKNNLALIVGRQGQAIGNNEWNIVHVSDCPIDCNIYYRGRGTIFLLYCYSSLDGQKLIDSEQVRYHNLDNDIVSRIAERLSSNFTNEKEETDKTFAPVDILDYIYAILHSRVYRKKYKEYLKIDFPRIPYPQDAVIFWDLVGLGRDLRKIHLFKFNNKSNDHVSYPKSGDNIITQKINKPDWELYDKENEIGRIWINETQYFDKIPLLAWEFIIGGYKPAQKWLKDRKKEELSFEDIQHYQKLISALIETNKIMDNIEAINLD